MISVSAAVRAATGLKGGDPVHVTLTVADSPPEVTIPADFAAALAADEQAGAFFGKLSKAGPDQFVVRVKHLGNLTALLPRPSAMMSP
jgi:hypothetical protein